MAGEEEAAEKWMTEKSIWRPLQPNNNYHYNGWLLRATIKYPLLFHLQSTTLVTFCGLDTGVSLVWKMMWRRNVRVYV